MIKRIISIFLTAIIFMSTLVMPANAMNGGTEGTKPWMNTKLSAEERTELLLDAMTMEQKIQQIAISRFNENDKGETVVINKSGIASTRAAYSRPRVPCPGVSGRTLAGKSVESRSWASPQSA